MPLLALAGRPLVHDDGALRNAVAAADRSDQELGGLVLRFLLPHPLRDLGAEHANAARRVRDAHASQEPNEEREHAHTGLPEGVVVLRAPEHPRPEDEVGFVGEDRLEQSGDVGRVPLAVGVEGDDVLGAVLARDPVSEPKRRSLPGVPIERRDVDVMVARDLRGLVGASVVDDERVDGKSAGLPRHCVEDCADRLLLVERRDDDDDGSEPQPVVTLGERAGRTVGRSRRRGFRVERHVSRDRHVLVIPDARTFPNTSSWPVCAILSYGAAAPVHGRFLPALRRVAR